MIITIFAKKRQSNDGRTFYTYLSSLTRKNGDSLKVQVKFRQACGNPRGEDCPMNLILHKEDCNLSENRYTETATSPDTGEITITDKVNYVLWVSKWEVGPE